MVKPSPAGCASSSSPVHHDATAVFSRGESWSYRGVRKRKWGKYVSEIRVPNSRDRIWLGSYDTAEKAARAFDAALFCLRGRSAKFNFPDNPPAPEVIRGGSSLQLTPAEIQSAAATFAHLHHPPPPPKITTTIPPPSRDCNNNNNMVQGDRYNSCSPASSAQGTLVLHNINGRTSTADNNRALLDLYRTVGSGNYGSDLGFFPEIDSLVLNDHLLTLPTPAAVDYGDHHEYNNMDPSIWTIPQDPFLWNF